MEGKKLEICTGDPAGVLAALQGGADRVELCAGLAEGGLTPSAGAIRFASELMPVNVLVRPRAGDFVYTPEEIAVMECDIEEAVKSGASGVVIGALTPDRRVDVETCRRLLENAEGLDNTFHRAFDLTADPLEALEEIIDLGFSRILTSGQAATALEGVGLIAELHRRAKGRIKIMAGAGVSPANLVEILTLSNADEVHASARSLHRSAMLCSDSKASMGSADAHDGSRLATDRDMVRQLRYILSSF